MSLTIKPGVTIGPGVSLSSPWAAPAFHTLTVTVAGNGTGLVSSTPAGIAGSTLTAQFATGTQVSLTAMAAMGSVFTGWTGGGASGTGPTTVTMDNDVNVTATFDSIGPTLVNIAVGPNGIHLPNGINQQMTATATFSDNSHQDYTSSATWSVADETIATVTSNGIVNGVAPGTTSVRATSGPITGSVTLTITDASLVGITITPSNPAVARDGTLQLTATGTFSDGTPIDLTNQVTWSSTNDLIATVDSNGLVTGHSGGSTSIHASLNSVQTNATLFVGS